MITISAPAGQNNERARCYADLRITNTAPRERLGRMTPRLKSIASKRLHP